MRKKEILNGYGFISEAGTITNMKGFIRKYSVHPTSGDAILLIRKKWYYVKNFMIEAFIPDYDKETQQIFFKDGNPLNLKLSNIQVSKRWGRNRKYTRQDAAAIKELHEKGFSVSYLKKVYNIPTSTLYRIVNSDL